MGTAGYVPGPRKQVKGKSARNPAVTLGAELQGFFFVLWPSSGTAVTAQNHTHTHALPLTFPLSAPFFIHTRTYVCLTACFPLRAPIDWKTKMDSCARRALLKRNKVYYSGPATKWTHHSTSPSSWLVARHAPDWMTEGDEHPRDRAAGAVDTCQFGRQRYPFPEQGYAPFNRWKKWVGNRQRRAFSRSLSERWQET